MGLNKRLISTTAASVANTENFAPVLYTGNGTSQSISSLDFPPDFAWLKSRGSVRNHMLATSVQQQYNYLSSNLTNAEATSSARITSLDSNGFTVGSSANVNSNNVDYVAWCWKAAGSSNTFNIIENETLSTSSSASGVGISTSGANATPLGASINRDFGFGIIRNSVGGSYPQVIAHGYGSKPDMIISKPTTTNEGWLVTVNKTIFGSTYDKQLSLNTTAAASDVTNSSRQITDVLATLTYTPGSQQFITYMFKSVDGYQKVGSYEGNGTSKDIVTGFEPRFLLMKNADNGTGNWVIFDSIRGVNQRLFPDLSNAENTITTQLTSFNSDGFSVGSNTNVNGLNNTIIYLAIA